MKLTSIFVFVLIKSVKCINHLVTCPKSSDNVFNLCFYNNGSLVKTTFGGTYGNGYGVVLRVDSSQTDIKSTSYTYRNIQIVTLLINISDQVGIRHVLHNTGTINRTISVAVHADTQIYKNDNVPIYRVDPMRGFRFADSGYEVYLLFSQDHDGHPAIDSLWYGQYNSRTSNLWVNATNSSFTNGDSELAYSWQNYTLQPNEKINFTAAFTANINFNFSIIPSYIPTEPFTPSKSFTPSRKFTPSIRFTKSEHFTYSEQFSESNSFSPSMTPSQSATASETPTPSISPSAYFSKSRDFTQSLYFTKSQIFTKSESFSETKEFTKSYIFSASSSFTESYISESAIFTKSEIFSESDIFSETNIFSESHLFSQSQNFLDSSCFSESFHFTKSSFFSETEHFSKSYLFSQSNLFTSSDRFSHSKSFTDSLCFIEYESSSDSFQTTNSGQNIFLPNSTPIAKKKGTNVATIVGIICGIIAAILISTIIVIIVLKKRRKQDQNSNEEDPANNPSSIDMQQQKNKTQSEIMTAYNDEDSDLNFWL